MGADSGRPRARSDRGVRDRVYARHFVRDFLRRPREAQFKSLCGKA